MKKLTIFAAFFLFFYACKPDPSNIISERTIVEGKVLNAKNNLPIPNSTVFLRGFNTAKGEPTYYYDNRTDDLVAQVKTDANGYYSFSFEPKADSSYRIVAKNNDKLYISEANRIKPVKKNEKQVFNFNYCEAATLYILYFNDKKINTDSVNFTITRYRPCESEIVTNDDSEFVKSLLMNSSLDEPNPQGLSGIQSYFYTEDNTEAVIKWTRFSSGKAVESVEKKLKPRITNSFSQDTIHVIF